MTPNEKKLITVLLTMTDIQRTCTIKKKTGQVVKGKIEEVEIYEKTYFKVGEEYIGYEQVDEIWECKIIWTNRCEG